MSELIVFTWLIVAAVISFPVDAADGASSPTSSYQFDLVRGAGTPVCEAYLKRLNTSKYRDPPYCDRPEVTTVPGFSPLNRVSLPPKSVHILIERVNKFMMLQRQGSTDDDEEREAKRKSQGLGSDIATLAGVEKLLQRGQTKVWRYDPLVDIDNDGTPDNILIWQGMGVSTVLGVCGQPIVTSNFSTNGNQPQVAFILAAGGDRLDVDKTIAIFGHPSGGYQLPNGKLATKFRPIGHSIGIFKYQDLYYMDTFFDSWGDFQNKRANNPKLGNILGVFLRRDGKTRQICEYHLTEPGTTTGTIKR